MIDFILDLPNLQHDDLQQMLRFYYDSEYGINSGYENHSFSQILHYDHECDLYYDIIEERMRRFINLDICTLTGWSFNEFINQPRQVVEMTIRIAQKKVDDEYEALVASGLLGEENKDS